MRTSAILSTLCMLSVVATQQQHSNNTVSNHTIANNHTIFEILNSTNGSSPAPYFAQFLLSSPDYKPIIDLLNDPKNNLTVFVPADGLFYNLTQQQAPTLNETNSTEPTTGTATKGTATRTSLPPIGTTTLPSNFGFPEFASMLNSWGGASSPTNHANFIRLPNVDDKTSNDFFVDQKVVNFLDSQQNSTTNGTISSSSNGTNITTSPFAQEFSIVDLLYYHIINGSQSLHNGTTYVFDSFLKNSTVNKFGSGSALLVQPGPEGSNLTVGDGLGYDASINNTFNASNGAIYIINKVLVPPVNFTGTLGAVQNASVFESLLNRTNTTDQNMSLFQMLLDSSNITAKDLNDATNITVFVPSNDALENIDVSNLDNQTINNMIQAHIFQGVYYSTNLTDNSPITAESEYGGSNVTLEENTDNGFTVNGTNVVQPNILLNNGVMHLIDGLLEYETGGDNATSTEGTTGIGANPTETGISANPSESDIGANPTETGIGGMVPNPTESEGGMVPTDSGDGTAPIATGASTEDPASSASIPTLASTLVLLSSTFFFYFLYV
ncbi:hypothetical protein HPULCUR_004683 [Helicostylum pulchrum]|uniref:FAS1 domain-containing protein n=1 Tax=Helicostylum pulchrum TaxID=562976 RepID=A0ABP9XX01_9FUNG